MNLHDLKAYGFCYRRQDERIEEGGLRVKTASAGARIFRANWLEQAFSRPISNSVSDNAHIFVRSPDLLGNFGD